MRHRVHDRLDIPVSFDQAVMEGQVEALREGSEGMVIFSAREELRLTIYRQQVADAEV